ncbi:hypothetical protein O181_128589 [Austropuccinia psidii MF-1]|uniref:Uncharacterized protein n=1 Tax=Austropuccinia psidii MF-1 TaxID=1389203 RepID=A0A9Q3Q896_9BASI|nr:hypothetical protein [Austropuccinia psidii MF-1]
MSPVYLRDLGFQRNQPEDREGLSRIRRPGRGHLGQSGGLQNNEGDNINPAIHTPIQEEPQTRGLEGYGSSSSAPPTPERFVSMEHGQQEVQPGNSLGRAWRMFPEDLSQRDRLSQPWQFTSLDPHMAYQATVLLWPIGHIHHQWPIWSRHYLMDHLWPFVFWGLHGPSPQSRTHSGNLCPNGYSWSFPSKSGEMAQMAVFGHLGS